MGRGARGVGGRLLMLVGLAVDASLATRRRALVVAVVLGGSCMHMLRSGSVEDGVEAMVSPTAKAQPRHQVPSKGCGRAPPAQVPSQVRFGGRSRSYIAVVAETYDPERPTALVLAFHGRTNSNAKLRSYLGVEQAADGGAIFVYPSGLPEGGPTRSWSDPGDDVGHLRDFGLFDQLLRELSETYCIDRQRVYVVGYSLGASFANSLACARGDVIRAMASLGGAGGAGSCRGKVATMLWHHPKDRRVALARAMKVRDRVLKHHGCGEEASAAEPRWAHCVRYDCPSDAPVLWCPHTVDHAWGRYDPHNWPSGAGAAIWHFFQGLDRVP